MFSATWSDRVQGLAKFVTRKPEIVKSNGEDYGDEPHSRSESDVSKYILWVRDLCKSHHKHACVSIVRGTRFIMIFFSFVG